MLAGPERPESRSLWKAGTAQREHAQLFFSSRFHSLPPQTRDHNVRLLIRGNQRKSPTNDRVSRIPALCGVPTLLLCALEQDGDSVMGMERVLGASWAAPTYNQRGDWSPTTSKWGGEREERETKSTMVNSLLSRE